MPPTSFGTKYLFQKMNETYVCEDSRSAITNDYLDIYWDDLEDVLQFRVQQVQVKYGIIKMDKPHEVNFRILDHAVLLLYIELKPIIFSLMSLLLFLLFERLKIINDT
ncbi:hypothetical protein CIL05_05280 [Virgibacillus profundi]|uniref:Uncharacterized protein n=1 Tax=Virgibacillus profundi TaxID=2024555 RepID=A0A2A2IHC1_9BACI|nr:hypothetical protein CIL05_05280 [Virgibacillus profundi]PXY54687.1 hypothetical protein CIT14_05365 [Virgibacillus profundi]